MCYVLKGFKDYDATELKQDLKELYWTFVEKEILI